MVTGETTTEAVTRLNKAEKTEVWTQARASVFSDAVTKHHKLSD